MKKIILGIVAIVVLAFGYWTLSPLFLDKKVNESLEAIVPGATTSTAALPDSPATSTKQSATQTEILPAPPAPAKPVVKTIAQGAFTGLQDHSAEGTATLLQTGNDYFVRFEENFNITNGPDLFVYLGKDGNYDPAARLGALKGNIGSQNYAIPSSISVANYNEVWVWCRAFSVAFGKAPLVRQ